jgi:hypothetical protein
VTGTSPSQNIAVTANGTSQTVNYQSISGGYYFNSRVANSGSDRYEHLTMTQDGSTLMYGIA